MSEPGERSDDRSPVLDFVGDIAVEGAGCLFEAAAGCAPVLLVMAGVPALLIWWM